MRNYELMAIHRPDLTDEDMRAKVADLQTFLVGKGATLNGTDIWGKRRFAYEIDHMREGYYSVLTFAADAPVVAELDRLLSLADEVVRHKVFVVSSGEGRRAPAMSTGEGHRAPAMSTGEGHRAPAMSTGEGHRVPAMSTGEGHVAPAAGEENGAGE